MRTAKVHTNGAQVLQIRQLLLQKGRPAAGNRKPLLCSRRRETTTKIWSAWLWRGNLRLIDDVVREGEGSGLDTTERKINYIEQNRDMYRAK